jgi:hypothetical protein
MLDVCCWLYRSRLMYVNMLSNVLNNVLQYKNVSSIYKKTINSLVGVKVITHFNKIEMLIIFLVEK